MSKEDEVYCCDEHGRLFVFRTIDNKPRPIAISDAIIKRVKFSNLSPKKKQEIIDLVKNIRHLYKLDKDKAKQLSKQLIEILKKEGLFKDIISFIPSEEEISKFLEIIREIHERYPSRIQLTPNDQIECVAESIMVLREIMEMIYPLEIRSYENIIEFFLEKDLKRLLEIAKARIDENLKPLLKKIILCMIYESIKRIFLIKKHKDAIKNATFEAIKSFIEKKKRDRELEKEFRDIVPETCDKNIKIILMGSASRLEATPGSDIELFLYSPNFEKCEKLWKNLNIYKELCKEIEKKIKERINISVDARIGTINVICEIARKERSEREKERTLFWLFTPLADGIFIDRIDIEKYIEKLQDTIPELKSGMNWFEWGLQRYRTSAIDILRELGRNVVKSLHYFFYDAFRFTVMKELGYERLCKGDIKDIRAWANKPYWITYENENSLIIRGKLGNLATVHAEYLIKTVLARYKQISLEFEDIGSMINLFRNMTQRIFEHFA